MSLPEVLVTGGAGYLGSCLVPLLLERGWRVAVFDTFARGLGPLLPVVDRVRLVRGDVRDGAALAAALRGVHSVVHLAAVVGYPACSRDPALAEDVNVGGTRALLEQLSPEQQLVFASTGSCYGAVGPAVACTEETPLSPLSVYGRTKAEAEALVLERRGVALRLATVFGVAPRMRVDLLVNDLSRRALRDGALEVYEPGFWRSLLHVRDAARAFALALERYDEMRGQAFNVGDDALNATKEQLARLICERAGGARLVLGGPGSDQDRRDYRVSHERIRQLGFRASVTLEQGVDELLRVLPLMAPHELCTN
ncbi:GDP-D-glycero-alpha-D-manno-heptose dehydrogenase-like [Amblyomma americanum]|uniref:NAD-dependent epimerase/dehydratase domain-containing protein n=1 Tax=Amblyomma americanum TaxID=6943 RepID=A0AAQ4FDF0_AMBAM